MELEKYIFLSIEKEKRSLAEKKPKKTSKKFHLSQKPQGNNFRSFKGRRY